jgi:TatD DNase family protein
MKFVDTHTHLYAKEFDSDRDRLINEAITAGITKFFLPNIDSASVEGMLALQKAYPEHCYPMMGLHPCSVKADYLEELTKLKAELDRGKFVAVGEIGIDLYWDKTFFPQQQEAFKTQCQWAFERDLPIVIHTRSSFDETFALLDNMVHRPKGVFHCFSGNAEQAQHAIDLGFMLGIGGVVTFKNAGVDKLIADIDLQHIVLETDAPYLAPVPHRGKRNEPDYLLLVAEKIATLKGISMEEVADITTANALRLFKLV